MLFKTVLKEFPKLRLSLLLRLPPNAILPQPPPPPCLEEFVSHYQSLLHPKPTFPPSMLSELQYSIVSLSSPIISTDTRGSGQCRTLNTPPWLVGMGTLVEIKASTSSNSCANSIYPLEK
ncbi:hypothetical protein ILYODFUR_031729 [Ilyodon furcidens]|uniref:Uncharacterized protein n=1 Tax=Ilyodon furcidens TaxID=33524 RepID=A0ABV0UWY2_9TELE